MTQHNRHLSEMEREMTFDHYKHVYNWNGIDPIVLARRYGVSVREVEATMRHIERINPKPKKDTEASQVG